MTQPTTETAPPTQPNQIEDTNLLTGVLARKMLETLKPGGPTPEPVLIWLKTQKPEIIRKAIAETQPAGWKVASTPLVDSLNDDQACAVLCALMACTVQML